MPGIFAFNFVLEDVLGGGGIASLRSDPQVLYYTLNKSNFSTLINLMIEKSF